MKVLNRICIALLLLLSFPLFGGFRQEWLNAKMGWTSRVTVQVTNATTGQPMANFGLAIGDPSLAGIGKTDRHGELSGYVPSPQVILCTSAFNETDWEFEGRLYNPSDCARIATNPGTARRINIRAFPGATVTGTVRGTDGHPLQNVFVVPLRLTYNSEGRRVPEESDFATTDRRGNFRLNRLRAGRLYLSNRASMGWRCGPSNGNPEILSSIFPRCS
jgi:hypothetical protein